MVSKKMFGALALAMLGLPATALAQGERCLVNGQWVYIDRGCGATSGRLSGVGPLPTPMRGTTSIAPRVEAAPPYLAWMSPACASLHDAIRTSRVRGLGAEAIHELQRTYQQDCANEEGEAQRRWHADKDSARQQRVEGSRQREDSSAQLKALCDGLRDVVLSKKRSDLSAEGRAQARAAYEQRCTTVRAAG